MSENKPTTASKDNPFQLPEPLASHPLIRKISLGAPPAVRTAPGEYYPDLEPVEKGVPDLLKHGLGLYVSLAKDTVLFNPAFVEEPELQAIDKAGKLPDAVPHYSKVSGQMPQPMDEATAKRRAKIAEDVKIKLTSMQTKNPKSDPKQGQGMILADLAKEPVAPLNTPVPVPPMAPPSPNTAKIQNARIKNLQPGAPSSGAKAGQGRIISGLTKPVI